ncbi:hypothetical protein D6D19_08064 [Aureobasidium pullulans]|uniref:Histone H1 n=1 Tax=Aureobasidium pullulans TaxID=5580 RepID=A0A4S9MUM4_AURPU|nr:hypothetical protein D6D28_06436 [Aureobasidium pullulans]THW70052.1 hypothetical protein D6D19_08064 [Aureobasidium pullulans]THY47012.1 hypothetical protein D6C97_08122 [Aureobasidium pullulans]
MSALKKYVQANNNLSSVTEAAFTTQFNRALAKGSETGVFERPKAPATKAAATKKKAAPKKATPKKKAA